MNEFMVNRQNKRKETEPKKEKKNRQTNFLNSMWQQLTNDYLMNRKKTQKKWR